MTQVNTSMVDYYAKRAQEYERIYDKPERQADLSLLKQLCAQTLAGRDVLEIACGTGYWTQPVSQTARSIVATDINEETLQIARAKSYGCNVYFERADAFGLGSLAGNRFTAGLAMHWWSHLRKSEVEAFLRNYHGIFPSGALLMFMDNRFVPGSSTPICRTDDEGNTFQTRTLADGTSHEVLKNFPTQDEILTLLAGVAARIEWRQLDYYWILKYHVI
jgi:SAM-dependent methyltransferase